MQVHYKLEHQVGVLHYPQIHISAKEKFWFTWTRRDAYKACIRLEGFVKLVEMQLSQQNHSCKVSENTLQRAIQVLFS